MSTMKRSDPVDAKASIVLHISKTDVRLGATKDASCCAAARALCRQEKIEAARVYLSRTYIKRGGKWVRFMTPSALRNEIIAFDRGGQFEPGEYTLSPVQPKLRWSNPERKAYAKKYAAKRAKHTSKPRASAHIVKGVRNRAGTRPQLD